MAWQAAVAQALLSIYGGDQLAQGADKDADALLDQISILDQAKNKNKNLATQEEYAETLGTKDIISGEIATLRRNAKTATDEVLTETGGSGGLADTGSTLDGQMAVLNAARKQEDGLKTTQSMDKAKNAWEADEKRKSIERNFQIEKARIEYEAQRIRQGGKNARRQMLLAGGMNAATTAMRK